MADALICPSCSGYRIFKNGLRYTSEGQVQRFLCRVCGFRFSNNPYKQCQTKEPHQLCVIKRTKKLDSQTEIKTIAGKTPQQGTKGKLLEFAWCMKKDGYSENTITRRSRILATLVKRGAELLSPETIKETIAEQNHWKPKQRNSQ